jgi:carboxypeptidase Taq
MLGWDAAAMMPPGGAAARGDQIAVLAGLAHGLMTEPAAAEDLDAAEAAGPDPDPWRAANLRLMRHAHTRATALPADLVEAQARANSACEKLWRVARAKSDFPAVVAPLTEVVRLTREAAAALASVLGLSVYDALMDGYQRGIGAADVAPVFARYEAFLQHALPAPQRAGRAGLRPCAAGPLGASVLRRHADRRAHHHALRRRRLHAEPAGRAARDGTRAVRARPAGGTCAPAGGRGGGHGGA